MENPDKSQLHIPGYEMILPDTMQSLGYSRLAALVKDGVHVKVLREYMDQEVATVWLKVSKKGGSKLHVGAVYRQHHLLRQLTPNVSGGVERQKARWQKILSQWRRAGERTECFVIGDINLDINKWNNLDQDCRDMTEMTKQQIELLGFHQLVRGDTRFCPNTVDSLVDHCWMNVPLKAASIRNISRARSDHNLLEVIIRVKGLNHYPKEVLARARGKLDHDVLKKNMEELDWTELFACEDIDLANTIFE